MVSTYFQLASHNKCMKKVMTNVAFAHEIAIINVHPTEGVDMIIFELAARKEHVVRKMLGGKAPDCSAERALQVMRVIEGWYASAASGMATTL